MRYLRRRQWQPTPVFLPRKSHGWRSLAGYSPWGCRVGNDWVTSLSLSFFFSVLFIYFLYNIVVVFAIYWHESATGIHVFRILNPPPSPSHPSGSSQCTSPEHRVSCIEPGLAIRFTYDHLHVSMPFSHIIPPSPSPTESKRLFYKSVSLLLSCIQGYHYHLSKFTFILNSVACQGL